MHTLHSDHSVIPRLNFVLKKNQQPKLPAISHRLFQVSDPGTERNEISFFLPE